MPRLLTNANSLALCVLLLAAGVGGASAAETIVSVGGPGFTQVGFEERADAQSRGGRIVVFEKPGLAAEKKSSVARFLPQLVGQYDVHLYWGDFPAANTDVNWIVNHARGTTVQPFNQRSTPGWHFHGSYWLDENSSVELTGAQLAPAPIVADAVKFAPTVPRVVKHEARDTITPLTLNVGDELQFRLRDGRTKTVKLLATSAARDSTPANAAGSRKVAPGRYRFSAVLDVDGARHTIERIIPAQESFYEPLVVDGMRIWLDAVSDIFSDDGGWMAEKDIFNCSIACRPQRKARIVVNDVHDRICPQQLVDWYPEEKDFIDVRTCYGGEDVWMGPYQGRVAHGGLDINMKSGTVLTAPIDFDEHFLFHSLRTGHNNNRWRAIRTWPNGSVWWLQAHHLNVMLVPEHRPLKQGVKYAETAGVHVGNHQHTHFVFRVFEGNESYFLDPWILFWQIFQDRKAAGGDKSHDPAGTRLR